MYYIFHVIFLKLKFFEQYESLDTTKSWRPLSSTSYVEHNNNVNKSRSSIGLTYCICI